VDIEAFIFVYSLSAKLFRNCLQDIEELKLNWFFCPNHGSGKRYRFGKGNLPAVLKTPLTSPKVCMPLY
jgi:hypothetical protein